MPRSATRGRGLLCFRTTTCFNGFFYFSLSVITSANTIQEMISGMKEGKIGRHCQTVLTLGLQLQQQKDEDGAGRCSSAAGQETTAVNPRLHSAAIGRAQRWWRGPGTTGR